MKNSIGRVTDQPVEPGQPATVTLLSDSEPIRYIGTPRLDLTRSRAAPVHQWGMSRWCQVFRDFLQRAFIFPMLSLTFELRVTGLHHLHQLDVPVLFAANHSHPADHLLILQALPETVRKRLAIAAESEQLESWGRGVLYPLIGNSFSFAKNGFARASLANVDNVLAGGWSVLIFPEGRLSKGGPIQPFKGGVGFCAIAASTKVVPLRLHVHGFGIPWFFPLFKRGQIEVVFGEALSFPQGTTHRAATISIEQAVGAL